ncbi:MAG: hypothetical protein J7K68_00290 [Candidatus Diapherotrites archaeon]|nr:hypothetical protein [Candidatus Diapherotrites archaeon]
MQVELFGCGYPFSPVLADVYEAIFHHLEELLVKHCCLACFFGAVSELLHFVITFLEQFVSSVAAPDAALHGELDRVWTYGVFMVLYIKNGEGFKWVRRQ